MLAAEGCVLHEPRLVHLTGEAGPGAMDGYIPYVLASGDGAGQPAEHDHRHDAEHVSDPLYLCRENVGVIYDEDIIDVQTAYAEWSVTVVIVIIKVC